MQGHLYDEGSSFQIDRSLLKGLPLIARTDPDLFEQDGTQRKRYDFDDALPSGGNDIIDSLPSNDDQEQQRLPAKVALEAIALAHRIQIDLEQVLLDFIRHYKEETGESNVCLAGGVALNSVLNGRVARELDFEKSFISPYPGDDGIAVGCCAFGLFGNAELDRNAARKEPGSSASKVPIWDGPISPYLGPNPSYIDMKLAIEDTEPWLEVEEITNEDKRLTVMAEEIESGGVVAWYHSRVRS